MKLYMHPMSGNSRKVKHLLDHLDLPHEVHVVNLMAGEQRAPAHLALNPNGRVPVLVRDGEALWESNAILRAIAAQHAPALLGERPELVDQWLFWQAVHLGPAMSALNQARTLKPMLTGAPPSQAAIDEATAAIDAQAAILDAALADGRPFICGDLSIADFALGAMCDNTPMSGYTFEGFPHAQAWLARVVALEGWRAFPALR